MVSAHVLLWQTDIRQDIIKIEGRGNDKQQASGNVQAYNSFISLLLFRVSNPLFWQNVSDWIDLSIDSCWHWIFERSWVPGVPEVLWWHVPRYLINKYSTITWHFIMPEIKIQKLLTKNIVLPQNSVRSLWDQNRSTLEINTGKP